MNLEILRQSLDRQGYALLPSLLRPDQCTTLMESYDNAKLYRKIIEMQRYRFGNIKHGISQVKSGQRYALGIIFHDAA